MRWGNQFPFHHSEILRSMMFHIIINNKTDPKWNYNGLGFRETK